MHQFEQGLRRYFSADQLAAVQRIGVGIAGAGGLGSNVAVLLARSGFCRLTLVDFDRVEAGNLNRQAYSSQQIGCLKVEALADNLLAINPALQLTILPMRLDKKNAAATFEACDVVVEALDDPADKAWFAEAFARQKKLLVMASGIAGFGNSDRIQTRQINTDFYVVGDCLSGVDTLPPFAPCVAIAAAKQADVVLAYALGGMKRGRQAY